MMHMPALGDIHCNYDEDTSIFEKFSYLRHISPCRFSYLCFARFYARLKLKCVMQAL